MENEKEQCKIDWKAGYLKALSDVQEFFGVNDKQLDLTEIEMKVIDDEAIKYAENKLSLK
jgi:hypothetical protein